MAGQGDALGPVQILVLGIDASGSDEMISAEIQDLANQSAVRIVDVLRARRDPDDEIHRIPGADDSAFSGAIVEALLFAGPERPAGSDLRRSQAAPGGWFLADRLPRGASVAILLVEHRWAIPLREAVFGFEAGVYGDAWLHPQDLGMASRTMGP